MVSSLPLPLDWLRRDCRPVPLRGAARLVPLRGAARLGPLGAARLSLADDGGGVSVSSFTSSAQRVSFPSASAPLPPLPCGPRTPKGVPFGECALGIVGVVRGLVSGVGEVMDLGAGVGVLAPAAEAAGTCGAVVVPAAEVAGVRAAEAARTGGRWPLGSVVRTRSASSASSVAPRSHARPWIAWTRSTGWSRIVERYVHGNATVAFVIAKGMWRPNARIRWSRAVRISGARWAGGVFWMSCIDVPVPAAVA